MLWRYAIYSNMIDNFKYYYLLVNGRGPRQMYGV